MGPGSFAHPAPIRGAAVLGFALAVILVLVSTAPAAGAAGSRLWVSRFHAPHTDRAYDVAVSPNGSMVYVTGSSYRPGAYEDWVTLGLSQTTGAQIWTSRYDGPGNGSDEAYALAVSPDGTRVYVAGGSYATSQNYTVIAYDATSGAELWVARGVEGAAWNVVVSADGMRVYLSGSGFGTEAYDASSGARIWSRRYQPAGSLSDVNFANALGLSPDGARVFVAGYIDSIASWYDYASVAYDSTTGAKIWARRYDGPGDEYASGEALAVSPDGARVYVTGTSGYVPGDWVTIAYDASTGAKIWLRRYDGPDHLNDWAGDVAVRPDGSMVYVTGLTEGTTTGADIGTIAYDAATGAKVWLRHYDGRAHMGDSARRLVVSPDGSRVYVAGYSQGAGTYADYATLAYEASAGTTVWTRLYDGPGHNEDYVDGLAVSPDGTSVFVTGGSFGDGTQEDYATLAYSAS